MQKKLDVPGGQPGVVEDTADHRTASRKINECRLTPKGGQNKKKT